MRKRRASVPTEVFLVQINGAYRVFTHGPAAKAWRTQNKKYVKGDIEILKATIGEWELWDEA